MRANNAAMRLNVDSERLLPTPVGTRPLGLENVAMLNSGGGHTCVVTHDAAAFCWGMNTNGQLGDGTTRDRVTPVRVAP